MSRRTKLEVQKDKLALLKVEQQIQFLERRGKFFASVDGMVGMGGGGSPYDSGSMSSQTNLGWNSFSGDPDDELQNLQKIRERSRDLYRNSPIGGGAVRTKASAVIGSGLRLQCTVNPKLVGLSPEAVREKTNQIERLWEMWVREADASMQCDLYELQDQAYRSFLISGDSFTMFPRVKRTGSIFEFRVKVLDGDRCSNPDYRMDNIEMRSGVKVGPMDEPVGYWFRFRKELFLDKWEYVSAFGKESGRRNVVHLMRQDRPGSRRGVPMLAIMASHIKQLSRYLDAETMATVISSFWTGFVESQNDDALESTLTQWFKERGEDGNNGPPKYDVGPGLIHHLRPGEKFSMPTPGRPNTAFGGFMQSMMEFAGMGLEMPYEILMRHYSSSYSASRGARIDWEKVAKIDRSWFNRKWNSTTYSGWLDEAVAFGLIDLPGYMQDPFVRDAWNSSVWNGDAAGLLDPLKEVEASIKKVSEGFSTRTLEAAGLTGMDFEQIVTALAEEQRMAKEMGVVFGVPVAVSAGPEKKPGEPGEEEKDEEGKEGEGENGTGKDDKPK